MQIWLAKMHSAGSGPDILVFRAGLQDRLASLPPEWKAGAVYTLDQVEIVSLMFAEGLYDALDKAKELAQYVGLPEHDSAVAAVFLSELSPASGPLID